MYMYSAILALSCCLCIVYSQVLYAGEKCKVNSKASGVCKKIDSCPSVLQDIIAGKAPTICSYEKRTPIVCCPDSASTGTTKPSRPNPVTQRPPVVDNRPSGDQSGSKAQTMCRNYAKAVWRIDSLPTLLLDEDDDEDRTVNVSQCGIPQAKDLIIGGEDALPKEFPHMAVVGFGTPNDILWWCGGSLISERFVLTAAHCLAARGKGPARFVRIGDLNLASEEDVTKYQQFNVIERIRHPEYKASAHYHDIALLKLDRDVEFTAYVRPACLNTDYRLGDDKPIATGWGLVNWADSTGSNYLKKVQLNFYPGALCNDSMSGDPRLKQGIQDDSMVCAGELKGGQDTCGGDSGGPLQVTLSDPYCMYKLVGITSFGTVYCGAKNTPAVYTRISHYIPWIEKHVWP